MGDPDLIPGSGRSSGEGNGNPLQYSCLGNTMDGGAGRLQSLGSQRVGHDFVELLAIAWSRVRVGRGREKREYNGCQNIFVT